MTPGLLGLAAFGALLALWVVFPHRIVRRRRAQGVQVASSAPAGASGRPLGRPSGRPEVVGVVDVRLHRPARAEGAGPAYELVVDLAGPVAPTAARIPVYRDVGRGQGVLHKERYRAEIAGLQVVAGNVVSLRRAARDALTWALEGYRLPRFVFRPPGGPGVPVVMRDGRLRARVPGGPAMEAPSLAALRDRVAVYLGRADLEVRALSWRDLSYYPACAVVEGPDLWVPLFREDGRLWTPDLAVRPEEPGVVAFVRAVRQTLNVSGPLTLTCLDPQSRSELEAAGQRCGYVLTVPDGRRRVAVEVWQVDGVVGCAPPGGPSGPPRVVMAADVWALAGLVGRELERAGRARAEEVRVHRAETAAGVESSRR
jgi:hypothetical protein